MSEHNVEQREAHWKKTRSLMIVNLVIWFFFSFVVHWFANDINSMSFIGFPLGYYMAAQGSLFAFVVQLFIFVKMQDEQSERR